MGPGAKEGGKLRIKVKKVKSLIQLEAGGQNKNGFRIRRPDRQVAARNPKTKIKPVKLKTQRQSGKENTVGGSLNRLANKTQVKHISDQVGGGE